MCYPYINIHTHLPIESIHRTISAVGVHPYSAERFDITNSESRRELEQAIEQVDAVGEIGLDYSTEVNREAQKSLFIGELKLAKKHSKPVVLHCVKAFEPTMELLSTFRLKGVIFHGFIGSLQQMNQALERGYYISFGERTFASPKTLKALRECPLERLFAETDMSDITIEQVYERLSKYRMESPEELRKALWENYTRLFPHKADL